MGKFCTEKMLIYRSSHPDSLMDDSVECKHGEGREGNSVRWLVSASTSAYKTANCLYSFIRLFLEANASCISSCRIAETKTERQWSSGFKVEGKLINREATLYDLYFLGLNETVLCNLLSTRTQLSSSFPLSVRSIVSIPGRSMQQSFKHPAKSIKRHEYECPGLRSNASL